MNNELLQKLTMADKVCRQANVHYEKIAQLEQANAIEEATAKKAITKAVVAGIVIWVVGSGIGGIVQGIPLLGKILGAIISLGSVILAVLAGYAIYKKGKMEISEAVQKRLGEIETERNAAERIFEDHAEEMAFLQVDYWYPLATSYLVKIIQAGRVDSLPEALAMFDEQAHRWKIEEANAEMLAQQKAQTANLDSIRKSSKVSAVANTANAIINLSSKL